MQEAQHPADGLAAFDRGLAELADLLARLLQNLAKEG